MKFEIDKLFAPKSHFRNLLSPYPRKEEDKPLLAPEFNPMYNDYIQEVNGIKKRADGKIPSAL